MSEARLRRIADQGLLATFRRYWRTNVYRRHRTCWYGTQVSELLPPPRPLDDQFSLRLMPGQEAEYVLDTNPYFTLSEQQAVDLRLAHCIAILDKSERIVASTWMFSQNAWISELTRSLRLHPNHHWSCKTFVESEYRGMSLASHMIYAYGRRQSAQDFLSGVILPTNVKSITMVESIGWRHVGDLEGRVLLHNPVGEMDLERSPLCRF